MAEAIANAVNWIGSSLYSVVPKGDVKEIERVIVREVTMAQSGRAFVRVAGLSGALAVGLGAYGAHVVKEADGNERLKVVYDTANRYHYFHTLALLGVPLTRRPLLVGTLMTTGMVMFCGSCYVHALTKNDAIRYVTPFGGMILIGAWLAMML